MDKYIEQYLAEGFAIVNMPELESPLTELQEEIVILANHVIEARELTIPTEKEFDKFRSDSYPSLRKTDPTAASFIYDAITRSLNLQRLLASDGIESFCRKILFSEAGFNAAINDYQLYLQAPDDDKNINGVHQDCGFFSEYGSSSSSSVAWIPFTDLSEGEGVIEIIPGSHARGELEHATNVASERKAETTPRNNKGFIYLDSSKYDETKFVPVEVKKTEVVFMDFRLIHRTGLNHSNKTRVSAIARFSNMYGKNYIRKYGIW